MVTKKSLKLDEVIMSFKFLKTEMLYLHEILVSFLTTLIIYICISDFMHLDFTAVKIITLFAAVSRSLMRIIDINSLFLVTYE